jgi:uncharacterized membrane protein (UPF0127 family)
VPRALRIDRIASQVGVLEIDGKPAVARCYLARGFVCRLVGLVGTPDLRSDEALLIPGCRAVHTIGMRIPIDVAFIAQRGAALAVRERLRPNRAARVEGADAVLEAGAGQLIRLRRSQVVAWHPERLRPP